jgi:putative membrane-bound dehydrogenase-like protein
MTRALVIITAAGGLFFAVTATAAEFDLPGRKFDVTDGFVVEQAAGPPLVERPITCDFDELGRLYVAESSGANDPVQKQLADKPHRVLRLEDTDGDGQFDKRTVFADKLMLPQGTMWFRGSLYVSAPPSIWKLTDTDGDGVADKREEWFAGKTLTGCANDLHGPYRGRDGWIYWCKGAFAEQTYDLPGKKGWKTRAAHIFRARPDGTGIEPVMTGGMDNPVDVVFTPEGERIFSCTFLQHPGGGKRDGLIHAIYGGVYGKDHTVLDGHPRTGDLMPVMTHLGPAAPCGLHHLESTHLGDDWKGNLLCCQFNLRKVSRHKLIPDGATYKTEDSDLLTSDTMDFHPTDVIEDADGSVIVCDTGGWYKLCCPTSQFHRPEALGAIYRVRRADAKKLDDPRGSKMNWAKMLPDELALYLDDPRHVVRERAIEALAKSKDKSVGTVLHGLMQPAAGSVLPKASQEARCNAVWAACRADAPWARSFARAALKDECPDVRQAAMHAISLWRDHAAAADLPVTWIATGPTDLRVAAEAFGRIGGQTGDAAVDKKILTRADPAWDRVHEHSLIYAVIESRNVEAAEFALAHDSPRVRRAALIALDGMNSDNLTIGLLLPHLSSDEAIVRDAAWTVAERHGEWGEQVAERFAEELAALVNRDEPSRELARRMARFAGNARVQAVFVDAIRNDKSAGAAQRTALAAMAQARFQEIPDDWLTAVAELIERRALVVESLDVLRALGVSAKQFPRTAALLVALGEDEEQPIDVRLRAFDFLAGRQAELSSAGFALLVAQLEKDQAPLLRSSAVSILARGKLSDDRARALADRFAALGPFEIAQLLPLYEQSTDEKVLAAAVGALESSPAAGQLSAAALRPLVEKLPASLRLRGEKLLARADANFAAQRRRLESLVAALDDTPGDVQRGRAIFHAKKAACASCHAIAYVGGLVGPDLTRIGQIRSRRDLVEAIAFPSASFVRSYEPVRIETTDGRQVSGIVREESGDEVVLAIAADKVERIVREEIESMRPGSVSVMPQGLDGQLTAQELSDLVAFLQSCR